MSPETTIPITVELSESLSVLANAKGLSGFERRLNSQLASLLKDLGLSGNPAVKVLSNNSNRAIRVRVHGKLQPYDPGLLKKIWILVAPPASLNAVEAVNDESRFPDGWLSAIVSNLTNSKSDLGIAFEFLSRVVTEIILEKPACLAGPAQVSAYMNDAKLTLTELGDSQSTLTSLLKSLLELGVNVNNYSVVQQAIIVGQQLHRSAGDIVESIFTQLRSASIDIHVHPDYLNKFLRRKPVAGEDKARGLNTVRRFLGNVISSLSTQPIGSGSFAVYSEQVDESIQAAFQNVESELFNRLGLQLPELRWVPSPQVPDGFISIKINDRLSPPVFGVQPGELLVHTSPDQLIPLNVFRRPAPITSGEYAIVNETDGSKVIQAGFTVSDISSLIPMIVKEEVTRRTARLLGVEDIEYQLAQLRLSYPALVRTATACYSLGEFTRVMRTLVAEGISIRNTRAILEGMLKFDTITIPSLAFIAFDDRLQLPRGKPTEVSNWRNLSAFVRTTLKHFIGSTFSRYQYSMDVFTVDAEVQDRAEFATTTDYRIDDDSWLSEAEQEALRDSVWSQFAANQNGPIITTTNARGPIHDLIVAEIPDVVVISYYELVPETKLQSKGQLTIEATVEPAASVAQN
jgi:FHIPEP family